MELSSPGLSEQRNTQGGRCAGYTGTWQGKDYALSRQWVIWHVIEHDLHHGGEVSLTLGMHGLTAPDL